METGMVRLLLLGALLAIAAPVAAESPGTTAQDVGENTAETERQAREEAERQAEEGSSGTGMGSAQSSDERRRGRRDPFAVDPRSPAEESAAANRAGDHAP